MVFTQIPGDVLGQHLGPVARRRIVATMLALVAASALVFVAGNIDLEAPMALQSSSTSVRLETLTSPSKILQTYQKLGIVSKSDARKRMLADLTASTRRLATRLAANTTTVTTESTSSESASTEAETPSAANATAGGEEDEEDAGKKTLVLMMGGSIADFGPTQINLLKSAVEAKLGVAVTGNITVSAGSVVAGVPIPGNAQDKDVAALVKDANQGAFQPVPGFPVSGCTLQDNAAANGEHWGPMKYWVVLGVGIVIMVFAAVQQASGV